MPRDKMVRKEIGLRNVWNSFVREFQSYVVVLS